MTDGLALAGFSNPDDFDRWTADPARAHDEEFSAEAVDLDTQPRGAPGIPRRRRQPADAEAIVQITAATLGLPLSQLRSPRKGAREQTARRIAIRCATAAGLTGVEIASALGITQQGVSAIVRRTGTTDDIEDHARRVLARLGGGS